MLSKILLSTAVFALAEASSVDENSSKCNALILSGGGSLGAWEAGVYYGLTHSSQASDFHYDVISGVSAGSINTSAACQFDKGDDASASEFLSDQWRTLTNDSIYVEWPGGYVSGILLKPGIYDTSPMLDTIKSVLSRLPENEWKRPASFATTDAATGDYVIFDQTNTTVDEIPYAVKCSASIPGAFPPTIFKGRYYIDGSTVENANIVSGIDQCKNLGYKEKDIVVDVYNCGNTDVQTVKKTGTTLHSWERDHFIRASSGFQNYLYRTMQEYPDVDYRYIIGVDFDYSEFSLLNFELINTDQFQAYGREAAANALKNGPNSEAKRIYNKVHALKTNQSTQ